MTEAFWGTGCGGRAGHAPVLAQWRGVGHRFGLSRKSRRRALRLSRIVRRRFAPLAALTWLLNMFAVGAGTTRGEIVVAASFRI
ncbi:hypothetical protein SPHINGO391_480222 [Sphingomonas aurantiaca]|uniref:Uncharacterized protein n=1 Tax=Sphingomonas aurantiaca TaxID=185949 RepID=A0A5E8A2X2_9SPHN|nr:hypothetical protein SPHINGO391_480222 [Sphingomonas aurantiaca]